MARLPSNRKFLFKNTAEIPRTRSRREAAICKGNGKFLKNLVFQLLAMRSLYRHKRDLLTADGEDYARLCHNFRPVQPHKATDVRVSFTLPDGHSCQQSPIDITTGATIYEPELRNRELVINYPETVRSPYKLINTGSTWKIYVPDRTYCKSQGTLSFGSGLRTCTNRREDAARIWEKESQKN